MPKIWKYSVYQNPDEKNDFQNPDWKIFSKSEYQNKKVLKIWTKKKTVYLKFFNFKILMKIFISKILKSYWGRTFKIRILKENVRFTLFSLFQKRMTETKRLLVDVSKNLLTFKKANAKNRRTTYTKKSPNAFAPKANATAFLQLCLWWLQWLCHWLSWKLFIE